MSKDDWDIDLNQTLYPCANCRYRFRVPIHQVTKIRGVPFDGSTQVCPSCHTIFKTNPILYSPTEDLDSIFDPAFPATPFSTIDLPSPIHRNPLYLSPNFGERGEVSSVIWKIWKHKNNVYITNNAFKQFKISIHESGWDHLSWLDPRVRTRYLSEPNENRHILKLLRVRAPDGVLKRIFRIEVEISRPFHSLWHRMLGKNRKKHPLMILRPYDDVERCRIFRLDCFYTSKPLSAYHETYIRREDGLIATFRIREKEYIHFTVGWPEEPTEFTELEQPGLIKRDWRGEGIIAAALGRMEYGTIFISMRHCPCL